MMEAADIQAKVMEEITLIPKDKLIELYGFIHYFRLGIETAIKDTPEEIMKFAGCWQDMTHEEFTDFAEEIVERRQQSFSRRSGRETIIG